MQLTVFNTFYALFNTESREFVIFEVGYFCLSLVLSRALRNKHLSNFNVIILTTTGLFPVNFNP